MSGNKRTSGQAFDQKLVRGNLALAAACKAKIDAKDGADSGDDWRQGKPIRVVRSFQLRKHSKYAPEEGYRYDGTYKVGAITSDCFFGSRARTNINYTKLSL